MITRHCCTNIEGEEITYYRDELRGRQYRRIVGGFSWPGVNPGYLVVVGENRFPVAGIREMHLIFELSCPTVPRLFRAVHAARNHYHAEEFYSDPTHLTMMSLWTQLTDEIADDRLAIWPVPAPHVRETDRRFGFYCETFRNALEPKKELYFDGCHLIRSEVSQLPQDAVDRKIEEFPALTALGFAVSALKVYRELESALQSPFQPLDEIAGY